MSEPSDFLERVSKVLPDNDAVLAVLNDPEAARFLRLGSEIAVGSGFGIARRIIPVLFYHQNPDGGVSGEALLIFLRENPFPNAASSVARRYFVDGVSTKHGLIASAYHTKSHIAAMLFRASLKYAWDDAFFSLD